MGRGLAAGLLAPIALVNLVGFIVPVLLLLRMSFNESLADGRLVETFSPATWALLVSDPFYFQILVGSVWLSVLVTVGALVFSYPIALYLHRSSGRTRNLLSVLVVVPMLTSAVVRTYGWIAILADRGLVPNLLRAIGIAPSRLIFNTTGVEIGLVEILMPYMILALLAGFGRLDPRLEEAASVLGARPAKVFWRVVLPLTLPGAALGCLLCFVLSISSFVTPKLLGGGRVFLLATEIYNDATDTLNWPLAACLSIVILVLFGGSLGFYARGMKAAG
jgi:putative spermidine/putrescine transport system permease protein